MVKAIQDMTEQETMLFNLYVDLEYALVQEYEHMVDTDNVSEHLKSAVGEWSTKIYKLGLIDDYLYGQAQKMAHGDDSWVNS